MLTALKLYDRAEAKNFFGLPIVPEQIEFSVLGTALLYSALKVDRRELQQHMASGQMFAPKCVA